MSERDIGQGEGTYNSISGNPVFHGPTLMARTINVESLTPPPVLPRQVPPPKRYFVNRTAEISQLDSIARAHDSGDGPGIVLLTGLDGVGKTQLISQWVGDNFAHDYPGGHLYADLEPYRRDGMVDAAAVLGGFLLALGVHKDYIPDSLDARVALFRSVTSGRATLVVVDNARTAPEVRCLLPAEGLLVATSRTNLPGLALDGAVPITVDALDESAALELIGKWHRSPSAHGSAVELVRLCGGLPFALRAVAEWLALRPHLTLDDAVRALAAHDSTSPADRSTGPTDGALSVDTTLDTVYERLEDHAKDLYVLLGVLPWASATPGVAAAAGVPDFDRALGELLNAHLATLVESADEPRRFQLAGVVRQHARKAGRALPEEERQRVLRAVADYYVAAAAHADALVLGERMRLQDPPSRTVAELAGTGTLFADSAQALEWLDAERANLLALLRTASELGLHDTVWRLCESLWALYNNRKHHADSVEAHRLGIEAAQWEARRDVEIRMRNQLARAYLGLKTYDEAERELARAATLLDQVADPRLSGMVWETQGLVALARGQHDEAYARFRDALEANTSVPDRHGILIQSYNVAQALTAGGHEEQALTVLDEAMSLAVEAGNTRMCLRVGLVRARALRGLGEPERAVVAAKSAAAQAAELNQYGKLDEALSLLVELAEECDDPELRAQSEAELREVRTSAGVIHGPA